MPHFLLANGIIEYRFPKPGIVGSCSSEDKLAIIVLHSFVESIRKEEADYSV